MKVIFLDVDGVLNHSACPEWEKGDHRVLDAACVQRVKDVCARTGAKLIISSTWRLSAHGMEPLLAVFDGLIIGVTPARNLGARHKEIEEWLLQHISIPIRFCIVDDDADAEIALLPFIRTGFETGGLTSALAQQLEQILT